MIKTGGPLFTTIKLKKLINLSTNRDRVNNIKRKYFFKKRAKNQHEFLAVNFRSERMS